MNAKLESKIDAVKKMSIEELCEKFNCKPEEICLGDYIAKDTDDTVCPYKVILGFANFEGSNVISLGDLEIIYGRKDQDTFGYLTNAYHQPIYSALNLKHSKIASLRKLRKIYGSCSLNENIKSMANVEFLGSNLYLNNSNVEDLGNITTIDGRLNLEDDAVKCKLKSFGHAKKIRVIYINSNCLTGTGDLEEFKEIIFGSKCKEGVRKLFSNFKRVGTKYIRKDLIITQ